MHPEEFTSSSPLRWPPPFHRPVPRTAHGLPMDRPRTAHGLRPGVHFERLWRMLVVFSGLCSLQIPFKRVLECNFAANSASNCFKSVWKCKLRLIFVIPETLRIELSPTRELNSDVFAIILFKTFPKLPKCFRKISQERFGRPLGMLWGSPGRSWAALVALLGTS